MLDSLVRGPTIAHLALAAWVAVSACSCQGTGSSGSSGGASSSDAGPAQSGGAIGTGGRSASTGTANRADAAAPVATGGSPAATGGSVGNGGAPATGGRVTTGGVVSNGGALATGGRITTGGVVGVVDAGATGGASVLGGALGTGGLATGGASAGTGGSTGAGGAAATFKNPLNQDHGSDPWMLYHDGNYYLMATSWAETIDIRKSPTIAGLKAAKPVRVWNGDDPSRCCNIWAPEFHLLDGPNGPRWYLYYVAGRSGTNYDYQRSYVLESAGTDPLGPYTFKGQLLDASTWAIDPSVLSLDGKLYFLYSSWSGAYQSLYITAMINPWTTTGNRVLISKPTNPWEQQNGSNVNEGPEVLQRGGKTFIAFSASGCNGPDYKLGLLTLTGSNPLDASAWSKSAGPVFQRNDSASVFGPGHNGFFVSPDGTEDWIIYHAQSSVTGGCDNNRTSRAQKITWNADGTPNFGTPVSTATALAVPSGE